MPLEEVVIALSARNDQLERDLAASRTKLRAFAVGGAADLGVPKTAAEGIGKAFAILSSAAALGGLTHFIDASFKASAAIVDLSRSLGISTDDIQKLHFAAALAGVSVDVIDESLARLSRTASEAANGNTHLFKTFEALGINLARNRELLN